MKIVVPLAGKDARFEKINIYKPLINIQGKPLIHKVLLSNGFPLLNLIFIILFEHEEKYSVTRKLKDCFGSDIRVEVIDQVTDGAPNTLLKATEILDDNEDILIDLGDVVRHIPALNNDVLKNTFFSGIIPVDKDFTADKWGYVISKDGNFVGLAEKSEEILKGGATMGLYYFSKGKEFVRYAQEMINKKQMVKSTGIYYVGPVYNNYKVAGEKIGLSFGNIKHVLGSPEQIDNFIKII